MRGRIADAEAVWQSHAGDPLPVADQRDQTIPALRIKPLIGVTKDLGNYEQLGMARTFKGALKGLVKLMLKKHDPGTPLRVQVIHALNLEGADILREEVDKTFKCTWMPLGTMSPVLGAHTGPSMVGVAFAALAEYPEIP